MSRKADAPPPELYLTIEGKEFTSNPTPTILDLAEDFGDLSNEIIAKYKLVGVGKSSTTFVENQ